MTEKKRRLNVRGLPDGRIRIHYFVRSDEGPAGTPETTVKTSIGMVKIGGSRGYIACEPGRKSVIPEERRGVLHPTPFSDDPRGVTCPECMATNEFKEHLGQLEELAGEEPQLQTGAQLPEPVNENVKPHEANTDEHRE